MTADIGALRDPACTMCRFSMDADSICIMGKGNTRADIMVVGKMSNSKTYQAELENQLKESGIDPSKVFFTQALKCRNFERNASNKDVKTCKTYLEAEIEIVKPKWILALGNEALLATTGHSGIMKYRGKPIDRGRATVIPTISPSSVKRNPGQLAGYLADLRFFSNQVKGIEASQYVADIKYIDTREKLDKLVALLRLATTVVCDIESVDPGTEFHPDARMVSISFTFIYRSPKDGKRKLMVTAVPLFHPESPFRKRWRAVLKHLAAAVEQVPVHMGHNTKYDARWCRQFGIRLRTDHDSLLMAHTLDENRQKGLKPQAQSRLGVAPWGIDTKSLLDTPLYDVLEYNALDTFYTWHISKVMLTELKSKPRQYRIYKNLMMPASEVYVDAERRGVWMDRERLATRTKIAWDTRAHIEAQLAEYIPEPSDENGWPKMGKKGKYAEVNWNASNWSRWFWFEHLGMPVLERGKEKDDGSLGAPSMAEAVMVNLAEATEHPAIQLHLERGKWEKYCSSFLGTYEEQLDADDRLHTTYKLHGAVTGRTSSGKVDDEKITASRGRRRGVNLQQVPRDPFIRGLFGAPPGRAFVEADFSQIELRLAAFLARERQMLHLYATGIDLHLATAARTMGVPLSQVTKDQRKKAKPVNFGFLYGMSWAKFIKTAWENYGVRFTPAEAEATRVAFFEAYPDLPKWYNKQRRLAREYGRVETPMGRVRHLPDIYSPDRGVRSEAERQAINSPVQGFASDMLLFGMALIHEVFKRENIDGYVIGTVHDACNFDIAEHELARALPIIKNTLENLPLEEKFDVRLDVPIVADLKVGRHWGDATELTEEDVYDWKGMVAS
jgi:uracil-DNA glycosylase family 4